MRLKLGLVGLNHGYALARAVEVDGTFELAAVCTQHPDRHRVQIDELQVPVFRDVDSMLCASALDGVVIAAPTSQLCDITGRCLARDIGVLIEKPAAVDVTEARLLQEAVRRTKAPVIVGYHRRLARQVLALRHELASGLIGEVTAISCHWAIRKARDYFRGWKVSRRAGGGFLMINFIHDLDTLQFLLGPIETVIAMQRGTTLADEVEHLVTLNIRFTSGVLGVAICSDQTPSPYSYDNTVAAAARFPLYLEDTYHFFGTRGSLCFPSFTVYSSPSLTSGWAERLNAGIASDSNDERDDPLARELGLFGRVLQGTDQAHATLDDAVQNLAVIAAVRRSLLSGSTETVQWAPAP